MIMFRMGSNKQVWAIKLKCETLFLRCKRVKIEQSALQVRNFYGSRNDCFSQPRACFDHSGKYIYTVHILVHIMGREVDKTRKSRGEGKKRLHMY